MVGVAQLVRPAPMVLRIKMKKILIVVVLSVTPVIPVTTE